MASLFRKATREQAKLRLALIGPAGSGKTYSALSIGTNLVPGGRVAVIDTECGSAELYGKTFDFDTMALSTHSPLAYVDAIKAAEDEGYDVIIVDSLSHAWIGKDGALEQVDKAADRGGGNSFTAWRSVTPKHTKLVDAMVSCKKHLIVTIRAKTEFVQEKNKATGKTEIVKLGLAPIQRDGLEYEFTLVGDIDYANTLKITKTRLDGVIMPGEVFERPGAALAKKIYSWLMDGSAPAAAKPVVVPADAVMAERTPTLVPPAAVAPVNAFVPPLPPPALVEKVIAETPPAIPATEVTQAIAPQGVLAVELDKVFAAYAEGMADAKTQVELDRAATGPGMPVKGTDQHKLAEGIYKRCKAMLAKSAAA